jgi:hypothetical protein
MSEKIIKIKKASKAKNPLVEKLTPIDQLVKELDDRIIKQSIMNVEMSIVSALSNNMDFIDTQFVINKESDHKLLLKMMRICSEAGYDVEIMSRTPQTQKLPDGKEITRILVTQRYHIKQREKKSNPAAAAVYESFDRFKSIINDEVKKREQG